MRFQQGRFGLLALVMFSLLFMSAPKAKADEATPVATTVEGEGNTMSAAVTGVSELPEVTVKAKGIDQAQAFDEMHDSLNKVNILSQDQINQTPAKTVAQAAQQLPGVGVQHDTGEPRYISIRGTDSNLDIVTFHDTLIPSYDDSSRSVDLDDIPVGLVGEEEVFKTILPDMDAQGVGGQMNLIPKSALDYPGSFHELKLEGGVVPERNEPTANGNLTWGETLN
ncbi:MAG TPA: TonB-dependent receptor plug domain-containing protein, partial [bacterium]|nr:TonB-dependent receptor plug domain-containing protein [bacterium]